MVTFHILALPARLRSAIGEIRRDAGYTLAELAVALAVAAIAGAIALFLFVAASASVERSQRQAEAVRVAHAGLRQVTAELRGGEAVVLTADGWTIEKPDGTLLYAHPEGFLTRNGSSFFAGERIRLTGTIREVIVHDTLRAHRVEVIAAAPGDGDRNPAFLLSSVVRLRNAAAWTEVKGR